MKMRIVLASKSAIKLAALQDAIYALNLDAEMTTVSAESGVRSQPVGREETYIGAMSRAQECCRAVIGDIYAIGIENGIRMGDGDLWEDWAIIVVITPSGYLLTFDSEAVTMPEEIVMYFLQHHPPGIKTVGELIAARSSAEKSDPHSYLTGGKKSRRSILAAALTEALRRCQSAK